MTRIDQMLHDFDRLAAAELDDIATAREPAQPVAAQPTVHVPQRRSTSSAWDWLLGAGVLALVMLAARR